jgi:hypothetical protein
VTEPRGEVKLQAAPLAKVLHAASASGGGPRCVCWPSAGGPSAAPAALAKPAQKMVLMAIPRNDFII